MLESFHGLSAQDLLFCALGEDIAANKALNKNARRAHEKLAELMREQARKLLA